MRKKFKIEFQRESALFGVGIALRISKYEPGAFMFFGPVSVRLVWSY